MSANRTNLMPLGVPELDVADRITDGEACTVGAEADVEDWSRKKWQRGLLGATGNAPDLDDSRSAGRRKLATVMAEVQSADKVSVATQFKLVSSRVGVPDADVPLIFSVRRGDP